MTRKKIDWNTVTDTIKKSEEKNYNRDDGYSENLFTPKLDEQGKYQGIIRFLPRPEGDGNGVPFVKLYNHGFKDIGGWFIENCPTTLKNECPVCKANSEIWDNDEATARTRGRRTSYYSNIYIVSDPSNKENEGKVFIFRYGKSIHDLIMEKISPEEGSIDEQVHIHDYEEGLNFKLRIKPKASGKKSYNDYSSSSFSETITPIADTDKEVDAIDKRLYSLEPIISPEKFKSFDVLRTNFLSKIGQTTISKSETQENANEDYEESSSGSTVSEDSESPNSFFENLNKD
jgi:hypothetical protein